MREPTASSFFTLAALPRPARNKQASGGSAQSTWTPSKERPKGRVSAGGVDDDQMAERVLGHQPRGVVESGVGHAHIDQPPLEIVITTMLTPLGGADIGPAPALGLLELRSLRARALGYSGAWPRMRTARARRRL
jgi:hypothetical protein